MRDQLNRARRRIVRRLYDYSTIRSDSVSLAVLLLPEEARKQRRGMLRLTTPLTRDLCDSWSVRAVHLST